MVNVFLRILKDLLCYWRALVLLLTPIVLLPLPLLHQTKWAYCGYVVLWMIIYWVTEVIPLPITACFPLFLFPMFGIMNGKEVSLEYLKDTNFVLIGSFLMAAAVEESHLHKRISLRLLLFMGSDPKWLMLGFQAVGGFLSMWIANAAVTAMLLPSALAVIQELARFSKQQRETKHPQNQTMELTVVTGTIENGVPVISEAKKPHETGDIEPPNLQTLEEIISEAPNSELQIYRGILLSLCYSANIGGTATLTGTAPTIALHGLFGSQFRNSTAITYAKWMGFAIPPVLVLLVLSYLALLIQFFNFKSFKKSNDGNINYLLRTQYRTLGPMQFAEYMSLTCFVCLILVWFFREPGFPSFRGWASIFLVPKFISIGGATMLVASFLFIVPNQMPDFLGTKDRISFQAPKLRQALLTWPIAQKRVPWGIILLVGGGFALAAGIQKSELTLKVKEAFEHLDTWSHFSLLAITILLTGVATEFTSNIVVVEVFLPVLATLSRSVHVNPLYLILAMTLKASFAFMLPVSTPPNAIVFSSGFIRVFDMALAGLFQNVICFGVICLFMQTYGWWFYDLGTYPYWAVLDKQTTMAMVTNFTAAAMPLTHVTA